MDTKQRFGGDWTIDKLNILSGYLDFYITALKKQRFNKIYIDAFAGTGHVRIGDTEEIIDGSAKLALDAANKFDRYIFIEKKKKFAQELNELIDKDYPNIKHIIEVKNDDCNETLQRLCTEIDWRFNRAILFLDPYAADVKWETLEAIAKTEAIDVWYLFPMHAANRMLKKDKNIDPTWKAKLDSIFGGSDWENIFYEENPQMNLFGTESYVKKAPTDVMKEYICGKLKTIFPAVSPNAKVLYNTKNSPLFIFCFAVANKEPKAIGLALKVANHILKG